MKAKTYIHHKLLLLAIFLITGNLLQDSKAQCVANFTYTIGNNGLVTFVSTSTGTSAATIYQWNYGPATFTATGAAGMNPSFTYSANGTYMAYLSLYSAVPSCSNTSLGVWINITNATNTCVLNANFTFGVGQNNSVGFFNTSTGVSAGATYTWDFGDGNSATGGTVFHTYSVNGIYNVTLTANNNYTTPCVSMYTANVNANTGCNFAANISTTLQPNGVVSIASNTSGTNPPDWYIWHFGDGSFQSGSNLSSLQHTYSVNGYYPISLMLSNTSVTCSITFTAGVTVTNVATPPCTLQANFNFNLGANGAVSFNNTSTGTVGITSYLWDFGNGYSVSSAHSPNFVYSNNQNYIVKLKATNNFSPVCISTTTALVSISNTSCNLTPSLQHVLLPNGVVGFTNTTTGGNAINYNWNFGDGSSNSSTSTPVMQHTYFANGTYPVVAALISSAPNCIAVAAQMITVSSSSVNPCNLNPSFTFSATGPGQYLFQSTSSGTTNATTYSWNFGNGTSSSQNPVTVNFPSNGQYVVQLHVNNNTLPACSASSNQTVSVSNSTCFANSNFTIAPTNTPQVWYAVPSFPWNISNAIWSWGDGSSSTGLFSSHSYTSAGNYLICLTVTASCGSTASACASYSISRLHAGNAMIFINVVAPDLIEVNLNQQNLLSSEVKLYPNPGSGLFHVELPGIEGEVALRIRDVQGKISSERKVSPDGSSVYNVDLKELPPGMYLLELQQGLWLLNKKLIITKD